MTSRFFDGLEQPFVICFPSVSWEVFFRVRMTLLIFGLLVDSSVHCEALLGQSHFHPKWSVVPRAHLFSTDAPVSRDTFSVCDLARPHSDTNTPRTYVDLTVHWVVSLLRGCTISRWVSRQLPEAKLQFLITIYRVGARYGLGCFTAPWRRWSFTPTWRYHDRTSWFVLKHCGSQPLLMRARTHAGSGPSRARRRLL